MSTNYQIWITYDREKQKIRLPVLPESFRVTNGSLNETVDISGLGEIVIKQDRPALGFTFSSFFPAAKYPGIEYTPLPTPEKCYNTINDWKNGDSPVHLIITGAGINLYCTIEDFPKEERGGDIGTIYYSMTLKEYREVKIRQIAINATTKKAKITATTARVDNSAASKTYTVVKGDCLWNIAKKYYGSGAEYTKIYNANKSVIGGNPNLIYPGQVLTIP